MRAVRRLIRDLIALVALLAVVWIIAKGLLPLLIFAVLVAGGVWVYVKYFRAKPVRQHRPSSS